MIELYTLGRLDLLDRSDGHQVLSVLAQPKRFGFLTYLALASPRGVHQRDTLLGLFWPDSSEKRARNSLNQAVFALRRAMGQGLLSMNGEPGVRVNPDHLWCDVWEFETALASGEKEDALELFRGNFLEGFYLDGCLEFERWVDSERRRLRELATGAVLSLSREMEKAGNPVGAVGWLRRAREWAPYDELVLRGQIELLLALGDRSGAVREFEVFARRLSVDLGMEPSQETQAVMDRAPPDEEAVRGAGRVGESTIIPTLPVRGNHRADERRFSLFQVVVLAILSAVLGVGAVLSAPRLWIGAASSHATAPTKATHQPAVVVFLFENAGGDPALDGLGQTASDQIVWELARTGLASVGPVLDPGQVPGEAPDQKEGPREANYNLWTPKDAAYIVTGNLSGRNGRLVFRTRIIETETGRIAAAVDTVVGSLADPAECTGRLARRVAGTLAMVLDPRLSGLTNVATHPPSYEAYQLLSDGLGLRVRAGEADIGDVHSAILATTDAFLEAAAVDSGFTLPLVLTLEAAGSTFGRFPEPLETLRARRDELPRWERAMLDYFLAWKTLDTPGQYEAVRRIVDILPTPGWSGRLATLALFLNRPHEALELLAGLEPQFHLLGEVRENWLGAVDAKLMLGDYESALEDIERARAIQEEFVGMIPREVEALARMGRAQEAVHRSVQYLESTGNPAEHDLWTWLPRVLLGTGFEEEAHYLAEVSLASLRKMGNTRPHVFPGALVLAGRYDEAREELAAESSSEDTPFRVYRLLAYMAVREGDTEEAIRLSDLARNVSEAAGESVPRFGVMSQVEVAAHLGDYGRAVRLLREAHDLGVPRGNWVLTRWDLTPLYGYEPFEELIRPKGSSDQSTPHDP